MKLKKHLSIPERHQLKIARDTLKLSDIGARIMGGMTKKEAKEIINNLGRTENVNQKTTDNVLQC